MGNTFRFLCFFFLLPQLVSAQEDTIFVPVATGVTASFRGLSVVDNNVAWVSGSKGTVGVTTDGRDFRFAQVKGYEKCDFRSIYAFDDKNAIIANAGSPAYILRTTDGGATWKKVYENTDTAAFIDGVDFYDNQHGVMYGDPIRGKMLLLKTKDGGHTWKEVPDEYRPVLVAGEASFAASGTGIKYMRRRKIIIATGGKVSRLLVSKKGGKTWKTINTPILQGQAGTGIFSFLALTKRKWIIAGGDYTRDTLRSRNLFYTRNKGKTWHTPEVTTRGYRECLTSIDNWIVMATGPGGVDISFDRGRTWRAFTDEKQLHVMKRGRGNVIIAAGGSGKLLIMHRPYGPPTLRLKKPRHL